MHSSAAFLHSQPFTQPFLHLHETSSQQAFDASGKAIQFCLYRPPLFFSIPNWLAMRELLAMTGPVYDLLGKSLSAHAVPQLPW